MPCVDRPTLSEQYYENMEKAARVSAMLCATLASAESLGILGVLVTATNESESGVKQSEIYNWWARHKREDEERKAREEATRRAAELKREALAKLTSEERKALGLK